MPTFVIGALSVVLCAALVVAGCGGDSPSTPTSPSPTVPISSACSAIGGVSSSSTAIVNGADCSTATAAVVLLNLRGVDNLAAGACSGTIIAPRAVLTAAHCLDEDVRLARVWLGSGDEIVATSFSPHPSYRGVNDPSSLDVGVVLFAQDLGRVPIPLLTSRDVRVGETAVIGGWGRDQNSVPATLRAGTTTIAAVGANQLETRFSSNTSAICSGDSGGPILISEGGVWAVAGVTSASTESTCNAGTQFYTSIRHPSVMSFILERVPDAARR